MLFRFDEEEDDDGAEDDDESLRRGALSWLEDGLGVAIDQRTEGIAGRGVLGVLRPDRLLLRARHLRTCRYV